MIEGQKHFSEPLADGRMLYFGQSENGMYYGEIQDWQGVVELATIKKTMAEVWRWLIDWVLNR